MDIKRFPEKMGDFPIDFSNPKRTLISGLFQETAKVGGQPRKFLTYIPEVSGLLPALSGRCDPFR